MLGVYVHVPVACFRKGMARELFETHRVPPPSTCYGFLLSLVGEVDRHRHVGCRVTAAVLGQPVVSTVLRTLWRIKSKKNPQGTGGNATPGHQQLLSHVHLLMWLDSNDESQHAGQLTLEQRVNEALDPMRRGRINRFGGLSLGESTHLVDEVSLLTPERRERLLANSGPQNEWRIFLTHDNGRLDLPVWVDHVGSKGTRYSVGELKPTDLQPPPREAVPRIHNQ